MVLPFAVANKETALQAAASVAGLMVTTECMITEIKEDKPAAPPMDPGMGGMM